MTTAIVILSVFSALLIATVVKAFSRLLDEAQTAKNLGLEVGRLQRQASRASQPSRTSQRSPRKSRKKSEKVTPVSLPEPEPLSLFDRLLKEEESELDEPPTSAPGVEKACPPNN